MPIHSSNHSLTSYTTSRRPPPLPPNFNSDNQSPRRKLPRHQFPITKPLSRIPSVGPFKTTLPRRIPLYNSRFTTNRVLAVIHAVKPLPPFNALAAYDLKSGNRLFLSPLPTDEEALANNVAVDYNGNAYVTNSIGNYIWKVNVEGEASIFSKSPIGDYLLVVQSNTGKVFKVDADDGTTRHILLNEDLTRPVGVVFRSDGVVLVVSPQANKLWLLKSNNGWTEGVVYDKIDLESEGYPTSVVSRGRDKMYLLYG
ncbi:hypothetical protein KIW84_UN0673 [Lathyrus oleraceus]|nr:hypothetical protein KIW84_UN0673 [Pisum sativum]